MPTDNLINIIREQFLLTIYRLQFQNLGVLENVGESSKRMINKKLLLTEIDLKKKKYIDKVKLCLKENYFRRRKNWEYRV